MESLIPSQIQPITVKAGQNNYRIQLLSTGRQKGPTMVSYRSPDGSLHNGFLTAVTMLPESTGNNNNIHAPQRLLQQMPRLNIQLPTAVELPRVFYSGGRTPYHQERLRLVGENPLLVPEERSCYAPMYNWIPLKDPWAKPRGRKLDTEHRFKHRVGMDHNYDFRKLRKAQEKATSAKKLGCWNKALKRLQNIHRKRTWRICQKMRSGEEQTRRQCRRRLLERKGFKAPLKKECPLYNCPKKIIRRKRPFMPLRPRKSPSVLSLSPGRSRSPIVIGSNCRAESDGSVC